MRYFYLVIDTSNEKGTKRYAYTRRVSSCDNILHIEFGVIGLEPFFVQIAKSKADAEKITGSWNDSHKAQGVYAPDFLEA
jgi:hypothetical protein